jgi:hypothetical protein
MSRFPEDTVCSPRVLLCHNSPVNHLPFQPFGSNIYGSFHRVGLRSWTWQKFERRIHDGISLGAAIDSLEARKTQPAIHVGRTSARTGWRSTLHSRSNTYLVYHLGVDVSPLSIPSGALVLHEQVILRYSVHILLKAPWNLNN